MGIGIANENLSGSPITVDVTPKNAVFTPCFNDRFGA